MRSSFSVGAAFSVPSAYSIPPPKTRADRPRTRPSAAGGVCPGSGAAGLVLFPAPAISTVACRTVPTQGRIPPIRTSGLHFAAGAGPKEVRDRKYGVATGIDRDFPNPHSLLPCSFRFSVLPEEDTHATSTASKRGGAAP